MLKFSIAGIQRSSLTRTVLALQHRNYGRHRLTISCQSMALRRLNMRRSRYSLQALIRITRHHASARLLPLQKCDFSVESAHPYPSILCYCEICTKTAGAGGYAINLGADFSHSTFQAKRISACTARGLLARNPAKNRRVPASAAFASIAAALSGFGIRAGPVSSTRTPVPSTPNFPCRRSGRA